MRWLVDECVDAALVASLRNAGHDAVYIAETAPSAADGAVMRLAQEQSRLLLTEDKDFGDLVFRRGGQLPGIVLLRVNPAMHLLKRQRLDAIIARFGDRLFGRYTVVDELMVRSRPLWP